jgi:MOSC domain-containing protein YiiM
MRCVPAGSGIIRGMKPMLQSVNVGLARPVMIHGRKVSTAIGKRAVSGPVSVGPLGLAGDEQADRSVHGGPAKAVYAYPLEHYAFWQTVRAQAQVSLWDEPLPPGFLGENLTLSGVLENQVWVGDILRFAHCDLAVSEPRLPCFKLNTAMGFKHASKLMATNGWCGFYLAVRQPGSIAAGETFELVPGPRQVGIQELFRARMASQKNQAAAGDPA